MVPLELRCLTGTEVDLQFRQMRENEFTYIKDVSDEWFGKKISFLLQPFFIRHFQDTCYVAEIDDEIIAFLIALMSQASESEAYIHAIAVKPKWRNYGVAQVISERFFLLMKKRGVKLISAMVPADNINSIALCLSLGYKAIQPTNPAQALYLNEVVAYKDYAGKGRHMVLFSKLLN